MYSPIQAAGFVAEKFIARGKFSLIYAVSHAGERYALKRCFLKDSTCVHLVLEERKFLERVSMQSNFLPTLYFAKWLKTSAVMVMSAGSGVDLSQLIRLHHPLSEPQAQFYAAEILCGLEHLHKLKIIHVDIKPHNTLIKNSGHIMITDFDHSVDISWGPRFHPLTHAGTLLYVAPEVKRQSILDEKVDIWSWASTLVEMIDEPVRDHTLDKNCLDRMARFGDFTIKSLNKYSNALQDLLPSCFMFDPTERPSIPEIKGSEFFKEINWDDVADCLLIPPFQLSEAEFATIQSIRIYDPYHPQILNNLHEEEMLDLSDKREQSDGSYTYGYLEQNHDELCRKRLRRWRMNTLFSDFNFTRFGDSA